MRLTTQAHFSQAMFLVEDVFSMVPVLDQQRFGSLSS